MSDSTLQETAKPGHNSGTTLTLDQSHKNYETAQSVLPGGTTRATIKRTPVPIYMSHSEGAYLHDVDGNRYLDFVGNYTAAIHGSLFPPVAEALKRQLDLGTCYANPTEWEIKLAGVLADRIPAVDKVRFMNSGTEAILFAVKAARAYTGKSAIAKLEGAYHGGYDWVEVSESSTPENWGEGDPVSTPYYEGMPRSVLEDTVVLPVNDVENSRRILEANADRLACIIVDIMPSRAGLIRLRPDYIGMLHEVTKAHGIVLISDEVLNFRYSYHGISHAFSLKPDLISFGKVIGGGLPIGAVGGSNEVMSVFDSSQGAPKLKQGGTFAANPLSMVAGYTSMQYLTPEVFDHLNALGDQVRTGIAMIARDLDLQLCASGGGSIFRLHLLAEEPTGYRAAWTPPKAETLMKEIASGLLTRGYMIPSDSSACCSVPMTDDDIGSFLSALRDVLTNMPDAKARIEASVAERAT